MNGQPRGDTLELSAEIARRAAAGLLPVGQDNDRARLVAKVKDLRGLLDRRG